MVKIRRARPRDVSHMIKVLKDAHHKNYSAAGEFYARQEMVDPNYEAASGPYYNAGSDFGMGGMIEMMQDNLVHDQDGVDWMRTEMKEHMNFTDEEFNDMAEHCPMMRGR